MTDLPAIREQRRFPSPAKTPQALAWHAGELWMGSRDLRRVYAIDPQTWAVSRELEAPGIPWAAVSHGEALSFTLGVGAEDDRYIRTFMPGEGFRGDGVACPELTGSYLSYDGEHLYLSQWYKHRIVTLDAVGEIVRTIDIGEEICGHTFVDGMLYVLRGTEQNGEAWRIARLDPRDPKPSVEDLAAVPFPCRSLTHDGETFWSNHRAADEIVSFALPA